MSMHILKAGTLSVVLLAAMLDQYAALALGLALFVAQTAAGPIPCGPVQHEIGHHRDACAGLAISAPSA